MDKKSECVAAKPYYVAVAVMLQKGGLFSFRYVSAKADTRPRQWKQLQAQWGKKSLSGVLGQEMNYNHYTKISTSLCATASPVLKQTAKSKQTVYSSACTAQVEHHWIPQAGLTVTVETGQDAAGRELLCSDRRGFRCPCKLEPNPDKKNFKKHLIQPIIGHWRRFYRLTLFIHFMILRLCDKRSSRT